MQLEVVLWEHEPLFGHSGFQEQIERPSRCDLVVSILWARLGTRLPADFSPLPGHPPPTGTEYEIRDALDAYRRIGKPNLLIYRKSKAPSVSLASDHAEERLRQYRMLDDFCRQAFYDEQGAVLVAHHRYAESYEFERKLAEHARKWLERQVGDVSAAPRWTSGSPYRGLQVFEAAHREIYFGRSQAVSELINRMRGTEVRGADGSEVTRFLLVQGMSGNGKSSLIRAGLLPLLEGRALEGIGLWRHAALKPSDRPGAHPDLGLTGALAEALSTMLPALDDAYAGVEKLSDRLRRAPEAMIAGLDGYIAREADAAGLRPEQMRLVIFIDQLDEMFAASLAPPERSIFLRILQALAREGRCWIVATLRSDFAARLEEYPELLSLCRAGQVHLLGPPRPDELADMIREPAAAAGLDWEDADGVSLAQIILRDATHNPESLPLLEYALDQLYARREGRLLTFAAYQAFGGLQGGIANTAEAVLTENGGAAIPALPKMIRNLVSVDESGTATRRYAPFSEFGDGSAERELLDALIARRLCVADSRGADSVVSFAHEALIHSWPRIRDWRQIEAGLLQSRDALISEAQRWGARGRKDDWLVTAPDRLAASKAVSDAGIALPENARQFAARSQRRAQRLLLLKQGAGATLVMLLIGVTAFAWLAYEQRDTAKAAQAHAQIEARTARATTDYLVGLFEEVDPSHSRGNTLLAREVIDRGLRKAERELADQPLVRAELLRTIGTVYDNLGLSEPGEKALREALQLAEHTPGLSPLETARARYALAFAIVDGGKYAEAEKLYLQVIDYYDAQDLRLEAARTRGNLGYLYMVWGRCRDAHKILSPAYETVVKLSGARSELAAGMLVDVGKVTSCLGNPEKGLQYLREAAEIQRQVSGEDDYWYAVDLYGIGFALRDLRRSEEAVDYFAFTQSAIR